MSIILKALEKVQKNKESYSESLFEGRIQTREEHEIKKQVNSDITVLSIDEPSQITYEKPIYNLEAEYSRLYNDIKIETTVKIKKFKIINKISTLGIVVFVILGVLVIINQLHLDKHDTKLPAIAPTPKPVFNLPVLDLKENTFLENIIPERKPSLQVTGILWDKQDPVVIVNGKFLKKGDEISGAKILDIQMREVTLSHNNKEFTISIE